MTNHHTKLEDYWTMSSFKLLIGQGVSMDRLTVIPTDAKQYTPLLLRRASLKISKSNNSGVRECPVCIFVKGESEQGIMSALCQIYVCNHWCHKFRF